MCLPYKSDKLVNHVYVLLMWLVFVVVNFVLYHVEIDDCSCNLHDFDYRRALLNHPHLPIRHRLMLEFHRYQPGKNNEFCFKKLRQIKYTLNI